MFELLQSFATRGLASRTPKLLFLNFKCCANCVRNLSTMRGKPLSSLTPQTLVSSAAYVMQNRSPLSVSAKQLQNIVKSKKTSVLFEHDNRQLNMLLSAYMTCMFGVALFFTYNYWMTDIELSARQPGGSEMKRSKLTTLFMAAPLITATVVSVMGYFFISRTVLKISYVAPRNVFLFETDFPFQLTRRVREVNRSDLSLRGPISRERYFYAKQQNVWGYYTMAPSAKFDIDLLRAAIKTNS